MMQRTRQQGRRTILCGAILLALFGSAGFDSSAVVADADEALVRRAESYAQLEYLRVLEVVRQFRPTTSDAWRATLAQAIVEESRSEGLDPLFATSIVARESSFKSRVVSQAGAVGLMQLRPWVAEDLALRSDIEWQGVETLHSPHLNVRLGLRYYKELVDRFGDERTALTAYCYGPTRVSSQLREGTYNGSRYATEILALYERLSEVASA